MTAKTKRPTLDQQRAAHAWKAAEHADKQFGELAKKLGPRILTAGLGPAVQFMIAKEEAPDLVKTLEGWLLEEGPTKVTSRPASLIYDIDNGGSDRLRWVTETRLAYLACLQ